MIPLIIIGTLVFLIVVAAFCIEVQHLKDVNWVLHCEINSLKDKLKERQSRKKNNAE